VNLLRLLLFPFYGGNGKNVTAIFIFFQKKAIFFQKRLKKLLFSPFFAFEAYIFAKNCVYLRKILPFFTKKIPQRYER